MYKKIVLLSTTTVMLLFGLVALSQAQLDAVGAINPDNGYPFFYQDAGLPANVPGGERQPLVLAQCLKNNGLCLLVDDVNTPTPGVAFPDNYGGTFPVEWFYWAGTSDLITANGGTGSLVMALEGSFFNGQAPANDQIVFARVRLRITNLVAQQLYTITTPYGEFVRASQNDGTINFTEDIGLLQGDFVAALGGKLGPFLTPTGFDPQNPTIFDAEGAAYIADAITPTTVVGSVFPVAADFGTANTAGVANFFRIVGPGVGIGSPDSCTNNPAGSDNCVEINQFILTGQLTENLDAVPVRTTYTRNLTDKGRIDVAASSVPGMTIEASIPGRTVQLLEEPVGSGNYYGRFPFNTTSIPLPADRIVNLSNITGNPVTTVPGQLTDTLTIQIATFDMTGLASGGTGTLRVKANSSDNSPTNPVTLTVFNDGGANLGTMADNVKTAFTTLPTSTIRVTSSAGGTATQDVLVTGPNVSTTIVSGQLPVNFGATLSRATYTRNDLDKGRIDIAALSAPGMNLEASIPGRSIQLLETPPSSGHYYGRFPFNATTIPLPADGLLTLNNLTDTPISTVNSQLTDVVNIKLASFNTTGLTSGGTGTLRIKASSSDTSPTDPVTLTVFSAEGTELGTMGSNVKTIFTTLPTSKVTVISSAGGMAIQDVVVVGPNAVQ